MEANRELKPTAVPPGINAVLSASPDWRLSPLMQRTLQEQNQGTSQNGEKSPGSAENAKFIVDSGGGTAPNFETGGSHGSPSWRTQQSGGEDQGTSFFQVLAIEDDEQREHSLERIVHLLRQSFDSLMGKHNAQDTEDGLDGGILVKSQINALVCFCEQCPYADVRGELCKLLEEFRKEVDPSKLVIPKRALRASKFIPNVISVNSSDPAISKLFNRIFSELGSIPHYMQIMAFHPTYLERFFDAYMSIMNGIGPLPKHWRNYLAILASARRRCQYTLENQEDMYIRNGGDPLWLEGIEKIPKKLRNFLGINEKMAHQPWTLNRNDIVLCLQGEDAWTISELVHGMVVVSLFHTLAGFIYGCGVTPDVDVEIDAETTDLKTTCVTVEATNATHNVLQQMKNITKTIDDGIELEEDEIGTEEMIALFEDLDDAKLELQSEQPQQQTNNKADIFSKYIGLFTLKHKDFDIQTKDYDIFRVQDYCWPEHAFSLVSRFYPTAAPLLDDLFVHIYELTYRTFHESADTDTEPFRIAIWHYVHRVKGLLHDDYNYQNVNKLLNVPFKTFLKRLVCNPETITFNDYVNLGLTFKDDEKCHIVLLAMEAAKQAELMYGLHRLMTYQIDRS